MDAIHVKSEQGRWTKEAGWKQVSDSRVDRAHLVLVFGSRDALAGGAHVTELRQAFPGAHFVGCSTVGEILNTQVTDDSIVATALRFAGTTVKTVEIGTDSAPDSFAAGRRSQACVRSGAWCGEGRKQSLVAAKTEGGVRYGPTAEDARRFLPASG